MVGTQTPYASKIFKEFTFSNKSKKEKKRIQYPPIAGSPTITLL
jgi:hypothetical protein